MPFDFKKAMENAPWRKTDQELIDHLSSIPIHDSHVRELLDRFVRLVRERDAKPESKEQ